MSATMKLGRLAPKRDPRTLRLAAYMGPQLAPPPAAVKWSYKARDWGMMLNDQIGCCAIAGPAHQIQAWTANSGTQFTVPDEMILQMYSRVGGYVPGRPETDGGCIMLDVMNTWKTLGVDMHQIGAYATCNPKNQTLVRQAMFMFGGLQLGLSLPIAAKDQKIWSIPRFPKLHPQYAPNSWGGHAVYAVDYDENYVTCVTWGELKKMTWGFFLAYCEEAYASLSTDWFSGKQKAPNGFDLARLTRDLSSIR